jgi:aryl-alcohol dehydrogenase-like predicted oxidoreductase
MERMMRYQVFGRHSGLVVSEFALGTGNFGTQWGYGANPDEARRIFQAYVDAGGNFIDTADGYQYGQSETLVGEFVGSCRDDFVVASKYTDSTRPRAGFGVTGNSRKTMVQAVEGSLKRLKTDRIDLYWVHYPDEITATEEIMRGLDDLAHAGKIVYAGLSNFPAWRIARAATMAELRGWAPILGVQTEYSLVERTADRELLPMSQALGLAVTGWGVLGGGLLSGKYRRGEPGRANTLKLFVRAEETAQKKAVVDTVLAVAQEIGATPAQVATAWVRARGITPILGPRTREQLEDSLDALPLTLTADHVRRLEDVSAPALGSPHEVLAAEFERRRSMDSRLGRLMPPRYPVG